VIQLTAAKTTSELLPVIHAYKTKLAKLCVLLLLGHPAAIAGWEALCFAAVVMCYVHNYMATMSMHFSPRDLKRSLGQSSLTLPHVW